MLSSHILFKFLTIASVFACFLKVYDDVPEPEVADDPNRWGGFTRFTTIYGHPCMTSCEKHSASYYWCYVSSSKHGRADRYGYWQYCSPNPGYTYKGDACKENCMDGQCKTATSWDYCGKTLPLESNLVAQDKTMNGEYCFSECAKTNRNCDWCYKIADWCFRIGRTGVNSWNFCSADPGFDVDGAKCEGTCDFHGETNTWCNLTKSGWNYCTGRSISTKTEYTYLGSKCITPCELAPSSDKNQCYDASGSLLVCSNVAGLAVNNKECTSNCSWNGGWDSFNQSYNWCWTNDEHTEWSYCSNVKDDLKEQDILM